MSIFLLAKTGLYGGIKVQLIAHKNETTLFAIDQHRPAKNEKRVPLWKGKNTFQQLQCEKMVWIIWQGRSAKVAPIYLIQKILQCSQGRKRKLNIFDRIQVQ